MGNVRDIPVLARLIAGCNHMSDPADIKGELKNCLAMTFPNCKIVRKQMVVVLLSHHVYGGLLCSNR